MSINKNELISRIQSCLYNINYSINERFFKQTLRMMLEYLNVESEIKNKAIEEFTKEIVAEYDNDGCPGVTDYLDYKLSIRELFQIAEQIKGE